MHLHCFIIMRCIRSQVKVFGEKYCLVNCRWLRTNEINTYSGVSFTPIPLSLLWITKHLELVQIHSDQKLNSSISIQSTPATRSTYTISKTIFIGSSWPGPRSCESVLDDGWTNKPYWDITNFIVAPGVLGRLLNMTSYSTLGIEYMTCTILIYIAQLS